MKNEKRVKYNIKWRFEEVSNEANSILCFIKDNEDSDKDFEVNLPLYSIEDGDVFYNFFKMEEESKKEKEPVEDAIFFISEDRKKAGMIYLTKSVILNFKENNELRRI